MRQAGVFDVREGDALFARTGHVVEYEAIERLSGVDPGSIHELFAGADADIGKAEVRDCGDALIAGHRNLILNAATQYVEAEKTAVEAGGFKIVGDNVLNERAAAGTALDIDGVSTRVGELAVFDAHVANTARGFAADTDAREDGIGHG